MRIARGELYFNTEKIHFHFNTSCYFNRLKLIYGNLDILNDLN